MLSKEQINSYCYSITWHLDSSIKKDWLTDINAQAQLAIELQAKLDDLKDKYDFAQHQIKTGEDYNNEFISKIKVRQAKLDEIENIVCVRSDGTAKDVWKILRGDE